MKGKVLVGLGDVRDERPLALSIYTEGAVDPPVAELTIAAARRVALELLHRAQLAEDARTAEDALAASAVTVEDAEILN